MPRLFTGLEIPASIAFQLAAHRGGLPGARWIDPDNYHVTLRFIGDIDNAQADDVDAALRDSRPRGPLTVTFDALATFGGGRPRAVFARAVPTPDLCGLQAEQEKLMRRAGLAPETRKYTPHVTLARLRDVSPMDVADYIAIRGRFAPLTFTANRIVLFSARNSVGGGSYVAEATYPLGDPSGLLGESEVDTDDAEALEEPWRGWNAPARRLAGGR